MRFKKPKFWDYKKPNINSYLLWPISFFIQLISLFKIIITKKKSTSIKTICIGNIYLGGTGKTSLSLKINKILHEKKIKTCFIKKFYPDQIDEQNILENNGKLFKSKKRLNSLIQADLEGYKVAIFDDGLQDNSIDYDLKIVCFNNKNWIGNGLLIPSGPLREKIESLKNYDIVFLNGKSENALENKQIILKINPRIKIFESNYKIKNLDKLNKKSEYLIFSGIGEPSSFRDILQDNNINVVKEIIYPDHYDYKKKDLENIIDEAKKNDAKILTTEKDFVKLSNDDKKQIDYLEIETNIDNEQIFIDLLNDKLNK